MKPLKGINQELKPIDQPEDTLFYGKNIVLNEKIGSAMNEPGFKVSSTSIPYTPIGAIPIDNKVIIFSTNNINSAVGVYDEYTDTYTKVLDRTDLSFNLNYPVTGRVKRNYKGDLICVFTDKVNPSKYINLTTANNLNTLDELTLFPTSYNPIISLLSVDETGGTIKSGAVYISIQLKSNDGTVTNWSKPFGPVFINSALVSNGMDAYIGDPGGTPTTKKIQFNISNIDTDYDKLGIAIINKVNGVTSAVQLPDQDILGSITKTITYSGSETTTDLSLAEVLTGTSTYRTVGSFAQVNGVLYGANLSTTELIKYQKIANNIKINYNTKLVKAVEFTDDTDKYATSRLNSTPRGFQHREVYAFYISFLLDGNNRTPGFHIPGRKENIGDKNPSSLGASQDIVAPKYQIEDTTSFISQDASTGIGTGEMGYWENQTEVYPNTDDFNSTIDYNGNPIVDGEDLRGKPVRHHRFPSISFCKSVHYGSESKYGTTYLDVLGIDVSNVIIPAEIKDKVQGWEIYYAKRTSNNSSVVALSMLQFNSYLRVNSTEDYTKVWSTGGNFGVDNNSKSQVGGSDQLHVFTDYIRIHPFDLMLNQPQVNPSFISQELKLFYNSPEFHADPNKDWWGYLFDYMNTSITGVSLPPDSDKIRKISQFQYVPRDTTVSGNNIYNIGTETYVHAKLGNSLPLVIPPNLSEDIGNSKGNYSDNLRFEQTWLSSVNVIHSDVYNSFSQQVLISTNAIQQDISKTSLSLIHGGDTFVCSYSYMTFGPRHPLDTDYVSYNKFIRRHICESVNNPDFRNVTDVSSKFWPNTNAADLINGVNANYEINRWAYNKDYTSVNDLNSPSPFDTTVINSNKFPNRIIRCKAGSREQTTSISWKTFLANDYFESVQHRGEIINIEAMGNDRLIIHHKDALYITRTNTTFQADITQVVLGAGDIFALPPDEPVSSRDGMLGTQHQLSCLITPYGYFFVDAAMGGVYLYDGSSCKDITPGLRIFLRDNLNINPINGNIDNPFTGNGISVAYDRKYKRILLSIKNDNKSFTLSYYPESESWGVFHDYVSDFIFNTRASTYSFKTQSGSSNLFIHNSGPRGVYYNAIQTNPIPYSSFVDVVFKCRKNEKGETITEILQSLEWISEVTDINEIPYFNETIDYITIWNNYRCSGKVTLTKDLILLNVNGNNRNPNGTWKFNQFRDLVNDKSQLFIDTIFNDYRPINSNINNSITWYNQRRVEGKYFIVRFEYANSNNKTIFMNEFIHNSRPSFR